MALEQFFGRIVDVTRRTDGDELVAAAAIGATVLYVEDTTDFDETGGQVLVGGDVYAYDEVDHDANTLTLTTTLSVASAIGDPVDAFDTELGQIVVEYVAHVLLDDQDIEDDPIEVTVNHALVPMLVESVRGGATETVTLIRDGDDDLVINQVNGKLAEEISADAAVLAAAAAFDEATLALTQVELAIAISDGRINTYYQTAAPWANGLLTHDADLGDLWYDTDSGTPALAYRWLGKFNRSWVLVDDQSIVQALAAANTAQLTADGKIIHFVGPNPPAAEGYGDIWTESDNDNKKWYWNGVAWMALLAGSNAIATLLIGKTLVAGASATSGERVVVRPDGSGGIIEFFVDGGVNPGVINPGYIGSLPAMLFTAPTNGSYYTTGRIMIASAAGFGTVTIGNPGDVLNVEGSVNFSNGGATTARVYGNGKIEGLRLISTGWDTTGAAANVYMNTQGELAMSTSSRRYKKDITSTLGLSVENFLALEPKSFRTLEDASGTNEYIGFIAEEAHDLGLSVFVNYDELGQPDGFQYASWTAALQYVARDQAAQIVDLKANVDALTARVEALEP